MCAFIVLDLITRLRIEKGDFPGFVTGEDEVGDVSEGAYGRLRSDGVEEGCRLLRF